MYKSILVGLCLLSFWGCDKKKAEEHSVSQVESSQEIKLSEISLDPNMFGDGWKQDTGLSLDTWQDLDKLPSEAKLLMQTQKGQVESLGVIALAEYSWVCTVPPLNSVTVRIFKFENSEQASEWSKTKYQYPGWEEHYNIVDNLPYFAVDSTQINKRCVIIDGYWITSNQLGSDDIHIKALEAMMKKLGK